MNENIEIIAYRLNSAYRIVWGHPDYRFLLVCFFPTLTFKSVKDEDLIKICKNDSFLVKHVIRAAHVGNIYIHNIENTAILMFNSKKDRTKFIEDQKVTIVAKHEWDLAIKLSA